MRVGELVADVPSSARLPVALSLIALRYLVSARVIQGGFLSGTFERWFGI